MKSAAELVTAGNATSPQRFAFGALVAYLDGMGRKELSGNNDARWPSFDAAILSRFEEASHGERSALGGLTEKYVWTGCRTLQAYLAKRVFTALEGAADPGEVADILVLAADFEPNPASDLFGSERAEPRALLNVSHLTGSIAHLSLDQPLDQLDRANEWGRTSPLPDMQPLLLFRHENAEWLTLHCRISAVDRESQGDSTLEVGSAVVRTESASALLKKLSEHAGVASRRAHIHEFTESIRCRIYIDPREAIWAPWSRAVDDVFTVRDVGGTDVELQATTASGVYRSTSEYDPRGWLHEERSIRMPAAWMRRALDLVDAVPIAHGKEWRFQDRSGRIHALFQHIVRSGERCEALVIRRSSFEEALSRTGQMLVWGGRLYRKPNPGLADLDDKEARGWIEREWLWHGFMTKDDLEIHTLSDTLHGAPEEPEAVAPPSAPHPPPVIPIGLANPDLAVPLSTNLDSDDAIPYFLWDDPIPLRELRHRLATALPPEQDRLLGKILREAREPDVWRFTTPDAIAKRWSALKRHLGRQRRFWEFLLNQWHKEGLLEEKPA